MTLFFYGSNTFALRQEVARMIDAYKSKAGSDFGLDRLDGAILKPRELQANLQATPFLASSRLVVVENLSSNKAVSEKLREIMDVVPDTTVVIFVERDVDQRTTSFKVLMGADKVVKFEPLSSAQLLAWCKHEIERVGGSADRSAIQELIDVSGEDQWRLSGEINKLVNFDETITAANVRELVTPSLDQTIFALVEAMTAGRTAEALAGYHSLLKQKQSEIYILTMIQWQVRNLLLAKTAGGISQAELANAGGMSPYVAGKMLIAQRQFLEETLANAYRAAADCEYEIKSGHIKGQVAVEQLIFKVATLSAKVAKL